MTQYGYAEVTFDVPDDQNMDDFGREYDQAVKAFQAAEKAEHQQVKAVPPITPALTAVPPLDEKAGQRLIETVLKGVIVSEEPNHKVGDTVTVGGIEFTKHSDAPWDEPAAPAAEPWKNPPAIDDLFG